MQATFLNTIRESNVNVSNNRGDNDIQARILFKFASGFLTESPNNDIKKATVKQISLFFFYRV